MAYDMGNGKAATLLRPQPRESSGSVATKTEGRIFADLHVHLSTRHDLEAMADTLSSGVNGLATLNGKLRILTYDYALHLLTGKVREIDRGFVAEVRKGDSTGYIVNTQEILSDFHILAVGLRELLPNYDDAREAVDQIHKRDGVAILNHPCVVGWGPAYRLIGKKEEPRVRELLEKVDEVEAFNSQCINFFPFFAWMKRANDMAGKLARDYEFKGVAASDTHTRLDQVSKAGIYVPDGEMTMERLKHCIKNRQFERAESRNNYVSWLSFLAGHLRCRAEDWFPKASGRVQRAYGWVF